MNKILPVILLISILLGCPQSDDTDLKFSKQTKLIASDGETGDEFGYSVCVSGDTAVVGAWRDDENGEDSGSAYIFTWNGITWVEQQKLTAIQEQRISFPETGLRG